MGLTRLHEAACRLVERSMPTGAAGERRAARYLKKQGYRILARNLRVRFGELDIVAEPPDGRALVFVEVKSSRGRRSAIRPEQRVGAAKQRKLMGLAMHVIRRYGLGRRPVRFDVIGVDLPAERGQAVEIRHHRGAFQTR